MTLKNNRTSLLYHIKLCASFQSHEWIQSRVTVPKRSIRVKIGNVRSRATLTFNAWPWKTIGHLSYATSSFVHHFVTIGEFELELQSGNAQFGSNSTILAPCDFEIWRMTLGINRAPLLSNIKQYVSFHHHMWFQTGVAVRKRLSWVVTCVTLTFDLWPWFFAWTLPWSLVITPENFMMIRWWEHSQKGVADGQTDRQTDRRTVNTIHRAAWSQLKNRRDASVKTGTTQTRTSDQIQIWHNYVQLCISKTALYSRWYQR